MKIKRNQAVDWENVFSKKKKKLKHLYPEYGKNSQNIITQHMTQLQMGKRFEQNRSPKRYTDGK